MKKLFHFLLSILLLSIFTFLQNTPLSAQTKTWTGATDFNWNKDSNWNPNGVPTATDAVDIPSVTNDPRIPSVLNLSIQSLSIQNGAKLTIHSFTTLNIKDAPLQAILNEGTIENFGKLVITNAGSTNGAPNSGIKNEGTFINHIHGKINMTNTRHAGIRNGGTFTNRGKIIIESVYSLGRGISVFGTFHNQANGEIHIKEVTTGMSCFTPFTNEGTIIVSHYDSNGISNQGSFINKTQGQIFLDGGVRAISTSKNTFTNEGKVNIGGTTAPETGVHIGGGFFNQFVNNGELNIFGVTKNGIFNNDKSKFRNSGTIKIGQNQIGHRGIQNQNIFENESGGELTIYSSNNFNLLNGGTLTDFADGSTPFLPSAQFTNHPCATLRVKGRIFNGMNSTFTNKGFLLSEYQGNHTNQETFVNAGLIHDLPSSFNGDIENQDIMIRSKSACNSPVFLNMFDIGSDNSFTISTNWYLEETLTNVVGTYDANSNTLNTSLTAGNHTLYFEVTDSNNNCTEVFDISITVFAIPLPAISGDLDYCMAHEFTTLDAGEWVSYQWSNSQNSRHIEVNAGTYTVTVTNQKGCTGRATAEISAIPCLADAGTLTTNEETICAGGSIEVNTVDEQMGNNYSQHFFLYTQDNSGTTILHESSIANYENETANAKFDGLEAGDYLVCAYNECQDCLPNPSPNTTDLDDIYQTGNIQDGCFDIECATITVPEAFEPNLEGSGLAPQTGTGMNVFIAEVCGGTAPYSSDFTSSGGFASVQELPSPNPGCINYQITYGHNVDWTLTVTDSNNCSNEATVFSSDDWVGGSVLQIGEATVTKETCVGDEDGAITIEVSGGDDSCDEYTYTWSSTNGFSETNTDVVTGNTIEDLASGIYNLTVTDCDGATVTDEIYVGRANGRARGRGGCKTAGNNEFSEIEQMTVYPNPFGERTMIEFSLSTSSRVWLSVYSVEGRKVASIVEGKNMEADVLQRWSFEADELQAGLYILELRTESGLRQHQQLVVVK